MSAKFLLPAALLGALGVAAGAVGAHAPWLPEAKRALWETAVRYQLWHALGLGLISQLKDAPLLAWSGYLMLAGVVLFSGSLYLLAISGQAAFGKITPCGGLALIAAWLLLAWHAWRNL
ncbi:hypothetical protein JCM13664_21180 [Methylothermus subterraneus]